MLSLRRRSIAWRTCRCCFLWMRAYWGTRTQLDNVINSDLIPCIKSFEHNPALPLPATRHDGTWCSFVLFIDHKDDLALLHIHNSNLRHDKYAVALTGGYTCTNELTRQQALIFIIKGGTQLYPG